MVTTTATEAGKLMEILEDAYWRLKDLDNQDMTEEETERVEGIIGDLDEYFA